MKLIIMFATLVGAFSLSACDSNFSNTRGSSNFWNINEPTPLRTLLKTEEDRVSEVMAEVNALIESFGRDLPTAFPGQFADSNGLHREIRSNCEVRTRTESQNHDRRQVSQWSEDAPSATCPAHMSWNSLKLSGPLPNVSRPGSSAGDVTHEEKSLRIDVEEDMTTLTEYEVTGIEMNMISDRYSERATLYESGIETNRLDITGTIFLKDGTSVSFERYYRQEMKEVRKDDSRSEQTGKTLNLLTLEMPFGPVVYKTVTTRGKDGKTDSERTLNGKPQ